MYKILSLDGGGSWAILQLLTLKDRYGNVSGHEVLRNFDLVIANSGGSIALATLAENWTLDEAITLFRDQQKRESIFSVNSFRDRFFPVDYLRAFGVNIGPKYSTTRKMDGFKNLFKEIDKRQMSELPEFVGKESLKLVVCTYDALNNRTKFFRSYGDGQPDFDSVTLTQAIHGSSNAPVQYFDFPARFKTKQTEVFYDLWDGALGGFNNPVLAGIIEAYKQGVSLNEIRVVSIGTGNKLMSLKAKEKYWDLKQETIETRRKKLALCKLSTQARYFMETVLNQAKTILYQPPDWANYVAMIFLEATTGQNLNDQFIRLSPLIHFDSSTPPGSEELIDALYALDMDLTRNSEVELLVECFDAWKDGQVMNQPVEFKVKDKNEVVFKKGYRLYPEAMEQWKSWNF